MALEIDLEYRITERGRGRNNLKIDILPPKKEFTVTEARDFFRQVLIATADEVLDEEIRKGFPKDYVTVVDGNVNKPISQVRASGSIEFSAQISIEEIAVEMWRAVTNRSRIVTGEYFDNHAMYFNGKPVASSIQEVRAWAPTAEVRPGSVLRMINTAPYARRLELLGVSAGSSSIKLGSSSDRKRANRGIKVRKPNGAYYLSYLFLNRSFSRAAGRFRYENIPGSELQGLPSGHSRTFTRQPKKSQNGRPYLYPSISLRINPSGVTVQ